jgi:hypothetical protein
VQVRSAGGEVLAEQTIRPTMRSSASDPATISSFGGAVVLRMLNAADRPVSVAITMQPISECRLAESERRAEVADGKEETVTFPVPRQGFPTNGVVAMPFSFTVAGGAAQAGAMTVNLRNQSRWWGGRKIKRAEPVMGGESQPGEEMLAVLEGTTPEGLPDGFFKMGKPPEGWKAYVTDATAVPFKEVGDLPAQGSSAIVGARLFAPVEREVKAKVSYWSENVQGAVVRAWINEKVVFDSKSAGASGGKPFLLRAGTNTMAVSWRYGDKPTGAIYVSVGFVDAKTGQPVTDLVLDMEGK